MREAVEQLTQAMKLPGGVYNFGSENDCNMYTTALRVCETLGIHPEIEKQEWPRSLLMDGSKFRNARRCGICGHTGRYKALLAGVWAGISTAEISGAPYGKSRRPRRSLPW